MIVSKPDKIRINFSRLFLMWGWGYYMYKYVKYIYKFSWFSLKNNKNMKKTLVFLVIVALFFFLNLSNVKALTSTEAETLIQILGLNSTKANIVRSLVSGSSPSVNSCYKFEKNLRVGDNGEDVVQLHKALKNEGFDVDISSNFFSEKTASAVVGLQEKYLSEILTPNGLIRGTGYFGPSTRSRLNRICLAVDNSKPNNVSSLVIDHVETKAAGKKNVLYLGESARIFGSGFSKNSTVQVYIGPKSSAGGSLTSNVWSIQVIGKVNSDGTQVEFLVPEVLNNLGGMRESTIYVFDRGLSSRSNVVNVVVLSGDVQNPSIDHVETKAENKNVLRLGESARIFGNGFSKNFTVSVYINVKGGYMTSGKVNSDGTQIEFVVPKDINTGASTLYVIDNGLQTNSVDVTLY